jgi:hypothetical protein
MDLREFKSGTNTQKRRYENFIPLLVDRRLDPRRTSAWEADERRKNSRWRTPEIVSLQGV